MSRTYPPAGRPVGRSPRGCHGSSKTTITNLITVSYDIADGKIRYDGININKIRTAPFGVVLQDVKLAGRSWRTSATVAWTPRTNRNATGRDVGQRTPSVRCLPEDTTRC